MQKTSLTEQGTPLEPQEEKETVKSLEAKLSFTEKLQSCSSHMQGEDMKDQNFKLELKLTNVVSDKQGFLKYINSKKRSKENIGLIFVVDDNLTNWSEKKVGAFSPFFLPWSLRILTDLGLLHLLIWRTVTVGIVMFCLCIWRL